jgi:L-threonylcarbamoyladenylate synthase
MIRVSKNIDDAVQILSQGDLVAIPTETVYGLAGNAFSDEAVTKIFALKKRPHFNPLIVHIKSIDYLHEVAKNIPQKALQLAHAFWPGSLTLVLPKTSRVPDLVTAGKETVAVRMPNHGMTLQLLNQLHFPLAAPSANPFGSISPTKAEHVVHYFQDTLELVLDGGPCAHGIESTIVGFEEEDAVLYRYGSISIEEIEHVIGKVKVKTSTKDAPEAPGMLLRHYAPSTTTYMTEDIPTLLHRFANQKVGIIAFQQAYSHSCIEAQWVLSPSGDLKEAAARLYDAMHVMDQKKLDAIIIEKMPEIGIGKSINDRLQRAIVPEDKA